MKKYFNTASKLICVVLAFVLVLPTLASCSKPPELETVKDELVDLIEGAYEINEIFFGSGLETVDNTLIDKPVRGYEYVAEDCKYLTTTSIKLAAEEIYTMDFLKGVYQTAFDGYADGDVGIVAARFLDEGGYLLQEENIESQLNGVKKYDYSTMKIVKPSTQDLLNVEIECWLEDVVNADQYKDLPGEMGQLMRGERVKVTLSFVLTALGWRLDTPSY